jgi:hypothetical protein
VCFWITIDNLRDGSIFAVHHNFAHDEWERCARNSRIPLVTKRILAVPWLILVDSISGLVTHDDWINQDGKDEEQSK